MIQSWSFFEVQEYLSLTSHVYTPAYVVTSYVDVSTMRMTYLFPVAIRVSSGDIAIRCHRDPSNAENTKVPSADQAQTPTFQPSRVKLVIEDTLLSYAGLGPPVQLKLTHTSAVTDSVPSPR